MTPLTITVKNSIFSAAIILAGLAACSAGVQAADIPKTSLENIPAGEAKEIGNLATLTVNLQDKRAKSQDGKLLRGVHAKSHGCVKADFVVRGDIKPKHQVGLFAHPGKVHEAWIRFSNAAVLVEHDLKDGQNGSRGMAIKVMDVDGDMLSKDNDRNNQDFLMINTPEFAFANVRDYHRLNKVLIADGAGASPKLFFLPLKLDGLRLLEPSGKLKPPAGNEPANVKQLRQVFEHSGLFKDFSAADFAGTQQSIQVVGKIQAIAVSNPLREQYFGAAPFLFGKHQVMKFSVAPCVAIANADLPDNPPTNYLREALSQTMKAEQNVCYDFKIKVAKADATDLNIENATITWPDELAEYVSVAKISIAAQQAPFSDEAIEHCEKLAFSPWHSLVAHKPIGGINRLRRKIYSNSAEHRGAGGY